MMCSILKNAPCHRHSVGYNLFSLLTLFPKVYQDFLSESQIKAQGNIALNGSLFLSRDIETKFILQILNLGLAVPG